MKSAGSQGLLLLLLAGFSVLPRVSSSHFRGVAFSADAELHQKENVSQVLDRWSSDHNVSAAEVAVESWLESYELDDVLAGAVIPNKILLNYKKSIGTLLYHAGADEKTKFHGTELLPAISRMMKKMTGAQLIFGDDKLCRAYIVRAHSEELAAFFDRQKKRYVQVRSVSFCYAL